MNTSPDICEDRELAILKAEVAKLVEKTCRPRKEADWYLLVLGSAATLTIVAVARLIV